MTNQTNKIIKISGERKLTIQHRWLYVALTATSFVTMFWGGNITGKADSAQSTSENPTAKSPASATQNEQSQALRTSTSQAASGDGKTAQSVVQNDSNALSAKKVMTQSVTSGESQAVSVAAKSAGTETAAVTSNFSKQKLQVLKTQQSLKSGVPSSAEVNTATSNSNSQSSAVNSANQQSPHSDAKSVSQTNSKSLETISVAANISKTDLKTLKEQLATENTTNGRPQQIIRSLATTALPADTVVSGQTNSAIMPAFSPSNSHQVSTENLAVAEPLVSDTFQGSITSSTPAVSIGGNGTGSTGLMNRIALHLNTFRNTPFLYTADPGLTISGGILGISAIDNQVTQNFDLKAETLLSRLKYSNNGQVGNIPGTFDVSLSSSDLPANTIIYDSASRSWTLSSSALMGVAKLTQSILDVPFTLTVTDPANPATVYNGKFNVLFAVAPTFTVHVTQNDRLSGKQIGTVTDDLIALPNVLSRVLNLTTPAGYTFIDQSTLEPDPLYHQDISTVVTPAEVYNLKEWFKPNDAKVTVNYTTADGKTVLAPADSVLGKFAQPYSTVAKIITGYTLTATPTNASGTYGTTNADVQYVYAPVDASVLINYVDQDNQTIAHSGELTGKFAEAYTAQPATIAGYTLVTTPAEVKGTFSTTNPAITYVYSVNPEQVVVKFVNESQQAIADSQTLDGKFGAAYTSVAKVINGYKLVTTPANATGKYAVNNDDVVYVYQKLATSQTSQNSQANSQASTAASQASTASQATVTSQTSQTSATSIASQASQASETSQPASLTSMASEATPVSLASQAASLQGSQKARRASTSSATKSVATSQAAKLVSEKTTQSSKRQTLAQVERNGKLQNVDLPSSKQQPAPLAEKLPQTNEQSTQAALIAGVIGLLGAAGGLFALLDSKKRRN